MNSKWIVPLMLIVLGLGLRWASEPDFSSKNPAILPVENLKVAERPPPAMTDARQLQHKILSISIRHLQQSQLVFIEAWRLLVGGQVSPPPSAMKVVASRMAAQTQNLREAAVPVAACKADHDELVANSGPVMEFKLIHVLCSTNTRLEVGFVRWNLALTEFEFQVIPNQVVDGVGESMALLNRRISCHMKVAALEQLSSFECQNLGQGLDRTTHIEFSKFEFHGDQKNLLMVDADRYKNLFEKTGCVSPKPCFQLTVPLEGRIHIVENRKTGKPAEADPVTASTSAAVVAADEALTSAPLAQAAGPDLKVRAESDAAAARAYRETLANEGDFYGKKESVQEDIQNISQETGLQETGAQEQIADEKNNRQGRAQVSGEQAEQGQNLRPQISREGDESVPANLDRQPGAELPVALNPGAGFPIDSDEGQNSDSVLLPEGQHPGVHR